MNISSVNLNLFVAFDALMAERNVTRAARRLGLTQSAVSNALRQLRVVLDDPLFLRKAQGVEPTARALALAEPVRRALTTLGATLAPSPFDPKSVERTFVLAASDYVEVVLLPPLLARLAVIAPRVRLEVVPWGLHDVPPALARGEVDMMLGFYGKLPSGHREEPLFREEFVGVVRRGHPTVSARPSLRAWARAPHVVVTERRGATTAVDRALAARGLSRAIELRVSHFLIVPSIVARTDMVALLSRRIAEPQAKALRLVTFRPPLALPKSTVGQVWHERLDADSGHAWLRRTIREVATTV